MEIDPSPLREFADRLVERLNLGSDFSVVLVSDAAMRSLHHRFKKVRRTTDVLAFPAGEVPEGEEKYLGDVVISVETARRQSEGPLVNELKALCLHGVLHLMGYDHETDQGEMEGLETRLREEFGLN